MLLDPKTGAVMKETGGIRKMRFAFEHRGKSGSIRIIYNDFEVYERMTAYTKGEKDNLTKTERNELKELVKVLEQKLEESKKED